MQIEKPKLEKNSTIALNSGNKIPMIGYGTYQLQGLDCITGVQAAIKYGYTHIDTASIYRNQKQISTALQKCKVQRQKLYITSKISPAQQGYQNAKEAVNGILSRLNIKYLDLILIHWPGVSKKLPQDKANRDIRLQTWKAFIQLKKQGKVKDIGVSNFLTHHLQHLLKNSDHPPAVNQFQIHPLLWEKSTIEFCRKNNIAIQAYSPLARNNNDLFNNQSILKIAKKHNKSVAQISLRWCLQNGFIILPKSKTDSRIQQNIQIYDFQLSQEQMNQIHLLTKKKVRTCWDPNSIKF